MALSQGKAVFAGIFALLLLGQIWLNKLILYHDVAWIEPPPVGEKWDPAIFKLLSFGNLATATDWVFIKCLTDQTLNKTRKGSHSELYYNLDLISDLDPLYFDAYYIAGNLLTVIHDDGSGAIEVLVKGNNFLKEELPQYPESFKSEYWSIEWQIPILMAYTYLFHLDDMPHASEAFQEAASFPGAPRYLHRLQERFKYPGGEYEVGLKLLGFMIENSKEVQSRSKLEKKRRDLFIAQYLYDLNQSFLGYLRLQPLYTTSGSISRKQMEIYFTGFMRRSQVPKADPWGGSIHMDSLGKIVSTTPYDAVFGLK